MTTAIRNHLTISSATPCIGPEMVSQEGHLETQIVVFLVDRKAQRLRRTGAKGLIEHCPTASSRLPILRRPRLPPAQDWVKLGEE